jgi:ParB family chromosome partitioning protein
MTAHVARNSGAVEWYTTAKYVEAARAVLGSIDLDPASSALANTVVRASTYYTWEEDGLSKHWSGRVWLNPPYSSGPIEKFTRKLADHYRAGDVSAAIVLVNNATETRWFLNVFEPASAACFIRGRIKFWGPAAPSPQGQLWGEDKLSRLTGLQGQCALYLGPDPLHFVEEWKQFGVSGRLVQP